jgi:hypothetical protein
MTKQEHIAICNHNLQKIPDGPWRNEGHYLEFKYTGIQCVLFRHPEMLHFCGLIGVEPNHPWYGVHISKLPTRNMRLHGGLVYAGFEPLFVRLEHLGNLYWLGFTCESAGDEVPRMLEFSQRNPEATYRTMHWTKGRLENFASRARSAWKRKWGKKKA